MPYKHSSKILFLFVLITTLLLISCGEKKYKIPKPDVSDINVDDIRFVRFDQELFETNGIDPIQHIRNVEAKHPLIFKSYTENFWGLVNFDSAETLDVYDSLNNLVVGNEWMKRLYDSVQLIYQNMEDVEKDLKQAIRYYKYYFPDSTLPVFYTYVGPFAYWSVIDEFTLGIELDMFMGEHFAYYGSFENNMPQYIVQRCNKEFIVLNAMQTLIDGLIPGKGSESTLLDEMIYEGKILYYTDLMLPETHDSIKIGYSTVQLDWCFSNEDEIWKFLAGEDLLFSKKTDHLRKYLGEAPTSVGMPEEAPGRVAAWIGWQIVRAYMEENKNISIHDLFNETDGIKILNESGYDPGS